MNNKKIEKFIIFFIVIQPFLDIITSYLVRNFSFPITLGIFVRGLAIFIITIYLLFYNKSKYKKYSLFYLISVFAFFILYFVTKSGIFDFTILFKEIVYLFKYFYLSFLIIGFINIFEQYKIEKEKILKFISFNAIIYSLLLIIPVITDTAISSYYGNNIGSNGWFYSANETGAILSILFPCYLYIIFKNKKFYYFIGLFVIAFAMLLLGTKAALFSIIISLAFYLIYCLICFKKFGIKMLIGLLMTIFIFGLFFTGLPAIKNLQNTITIVKNEQEANESKPGGSSKPVDKENIIIFSGRKKFLQSAFDFYKKAPIQDKIFGIGFTNRPQFDNIKVEKLIEMDVFDIALRYGIVGFIIYFAPFLYIAYILIKKLFSNIRSLNFEIIFLSFTILLGCGISTLAGHVFGAPSVSIYLAIFLALLLLECNVSIKND